MPSERPPLREWPTFAIVIVGHGLLPKHLVSAVGMRSETDVPSFLPSFLPRRKALLALTSAGLAPLAVACVDDDLTEAPMSPAADTGLAAYGDPLADGGAGGDSIVHPARGRIDLTISTTSSLRPNAAVELTIGGVAREAIDSGEVVLTLPTRALMDHAGADRGLPELPVKARWTLPAIAKGGTWSGSYTVPGEVAGWYRVLANAYTHGPDGGPWLFDDVLREAWMVVDETDGRLTRILEDSVAPMAGPAAGWPAGPLARSPDRPYWHGDSVYLHVVYVASQWEGFRPAVDAWIRANWTKVDGGDVEAGSRVPEDGIVAFPCRGVKNLSLWGDAEAPETDLVQGRDDIARWETNALHCGTLVEVEVLAHRYYPWHLLNLAADTLQKHFGHERGRINWGLHFKDPSEHRSYYKSAPFYEKITLAWLAADRNHFRWTVAHEYGHALHEKALGGIWWRSPRCGREDREYPYRATSYECALKEGFADYAGTVGSGLYEDCLEYLGTPNAPGWCRDITHEQKPGDRVVGRRALHGPDRRQRQPGGLLRRRLRRQDALPRRLHRHGVQDLRGQAGQLAGPLVGPEQGLRLCLVPRGVRRQADATSGCSPTPASRTPRSTRPISRPTGTHWTSGRPGYETWQRREDENESSHRSHWKHLPWPPPSRRRPVRRGGLPPASSDAEPVGDGDGGPRDAGRRHGGGAPSRPPLRPRLHRRRQSQWHLVEGPIGRSGGGRRLDFGLLRSQDRRPRRGGFRTRDRGIRVWIRRRPQLLLRPRVPRAGSGPVGATSRIAAREALTRRFFCDSGRIRGDRREPEAHRRPLTRNSGRPGSLPVRAILAGGRPGGEVRSTAVR